MKAPKLTPKQIATYFFTKSKANPKTWTCLCGTARERTGTGYNYLNGHVIYAHEVYEDTVREAHRQQTNDSVFTPVIVTNKARKLFLWLEIVIGDLEPFNYIEKPLKLKYVKMESICSENLLMCIHVETN